MSWKEYPRGTDMTNNFFGTVNMKKYALRGLSLLLVAIMAVSSLSITAFAAEDEEATITYVKGANYASESYIAGKYYKNLTSLPLTGDNVTDLLAVALSQIGYMESDSLDDISGTLGGGNNFTEYNWNMGDFGSGYGTGNYDWCASFVSFCLLQSRSTEQNKLSDWCRNHMGDADYIWREVGCPKWAQNLTETGYYQKSLANGGTYQPKSGDLIFFRWSPEKAIGHIGIVLYSDSERVYTVEGNTSGGSTMVSNGGGVHFKNYELDYSCIDGYGTPPYKTNDEVAKIDYSGENVSAGLYVATTGKYLYADTSLEGEYQIIPSGTLFEVTEVVENGIGGMLKAVCEIDGEKLEGYVVNNDTDRVIQLTSTVPPTKPISFLHFDKTEGFVGGAVTGYLNSGETHNGEAMKVEEGGCVSLCGWFGYEQKIIAGGYYLDGNRENIKWVSDALLEDEPSDEQINGGGENTVLCEIDAELLDLMRGKHQVTFLLKLDNGVITILDTLDFTVVEKRKPPVEKPTEKLTETDTPTESEPLASESEGESNDTSSTNAGGCSSSLGATVAIVALCATACCTLAGRKREE